MQATRSSKYPLDPWYIISLRAERTEHVAQRRTLGFPVTMRFKGLEYKGKSVEAVQHEEAGDFCIRWNISRLRNTEVKIDETSGRQRNFINLENGMASNENSRRDGADPPKKESGTASSVCPCGGAESPRCVTSRKDICIVAKTFSS
jgi:hypothetical protein